MISGARKRSQQSPICANRCASTPGRLIPRTCKGQTTEEPTDTRVADMRDCSQREKETTRSTGSANQRSHVREDEPRHRAAHSNSDTHNHTHHTHTHARAHAHTHTPSLHHSITPSLYHSVTPSFTHSTHSLPHSLTHSRTHHCGKSCCCCLRCAA